MSHTPRAAFVLAVIVVAISGCGGGSKSSSQASSATDAKTTTSLQASTGPTRKGELSRAVLIARADTICTGIRHMLGSNKFHTQKQIALLGPKIAAYERKAAAELGKLVPPSSLADDWKQIVKGIELLASDAASIGEYAKADRLETPAGHAVVLASGRHGILEAEIARRDGFVTCAITL